MEGFENLHVLFARSFKMTHNVDVRSDISRKILNSLYLYKASILLLRSQVQYFLFNGISYADASIG